MNVYTAARIEIAWFSMIAFGGGYLLGSGSWVGWLVAGFLIWVGLTMIRDDWVERKLMKESRLLTERLWGKAMKRNQN